MTSLRYIAALLPALVGAAAYALPTDYYATASRLDPTAAHWVKVTVKETGVQAISYDDLRNWGFAHPEAVRVYGFSGVELAPNTFSTSMPDDLPQQYSEHIDGTLYFYGEGDVRAIPVSAKAIEVTRNFYSSTSTYFLSDASAEALPDAAPFTEGYAVLETHTALEYIERELQLPGGTVFLSKTLNVGGAPDEYTFPYVDAATETAYLNYMYAAKTSKQMRMRPTYTANVAEGQASTNPHTATAAVDPSSQTYSYSRYNAMAKPSQVPLTVSAGNEVGVSFAHPATEGLTFVAVDYAALLYERRNSLAHGPRVMSFPSFPGQRNVEVQGATAQTRLWDVTTPLAVTPLETHYADNAATGTPTAIAGTARVAAFTPGEGEFARPIYQGVVEHHANLHGIMETPQMVIICADNLLPAAERLAQLHRDKDGMTVIAVAQSDIFNEFSSGSTSMIAYRRFLKMLHDRKPGTLQYALIMGKGTDDNRAMISTEPYERTMTYQCEDPREEGAKWSRMETKSFVFDSYIGMLDDMFTPARIEKANIDLGVGRISVATVTDADRQIDKIERYYDELGSAVFAHRTMFICDNGDDNKHLDMAQDAVNALQEGAPYMHVAHAYQNLFDHNTSRLGDYARECLANGVSLGAYDGHGAYNFIGFPQIFNTITASSASFGCASVLFISACSSLVMDAGRPNIGVAFGDMPHGPVAVIGASRTVFLENNTRMYSAFADAWAGKTKDGTVIRRLGDAFRYSINYTNKTFLLDLNQLVNNFTYNIMGDPALPLHIANRELKVTEVNGVRPTAVVDVDALSPFTVAGVVTLADGSIDTAFNGNVVLTLRDGAWTQTTLAQDGDPQRDIAMEGHIIALVSTKAQNGRWSATLVPPVPMRLGDTHPLHITAAQDYDTFAGLRWDGIRINDIDPETVSDDSEGPQIRALYLNDAARPAELPVGPNPILYAELYDPSGIAVNPSIIGSNVTVTLDGVMTFDHVGGALRPNNDGSMTVKVALNNLGDGYHTLQLEAYDTQGNVTRRTLSFTVIAETSTLALTADRDLYLGDEDVTLDLDLPVSVNATRLVIEGPLGEHVLAVDAPTLPYTWTPDAALPEGKYTARLFFRQISVYGSTQPATFTIIRP